MTNKLCDELGSNERLCFWKLAFDVGTYLNESNQISLASLANEAQASDANKYKEGERFVCGFTGNSLMSNGCWAGLEANQA